MAKIKIYFRGQQFEIDEELFAETVAMLKARLAAISGGAVNPDEPGEPDHVTLIPGIYESGAIRKAIAGDTSASNMLIKSWAELVAEGSLSDGGFIHDDNWDITWRGYTGDLVLPAGSDWLDFNDDNGGNGRITGLLVPEGTERFADYSFTGIFNLDIVVLPASMRDFGQLSLGYLVGYSSSNTDVYYGGTEEQWNVFADDEYYGANGYDEYYTAYFNFEHTIEILPSNTDEPEEPEQPDPVPEPEPDPDPVPEPEPDVPEITTFEPGLYTHGAIELAEGGDIVTASSKKIMTWDDALDANIIEVAGTAVINTDYDYFNDFDENVGVDIVVPEGITAIGDPEHMGGEGLSGRHTIKGVKLPSSIQRLEDYAFGSSGIEILVFESNSNLEYIGQEAIYQTALRLITLPTTVSVIKFRGLGGNSWMQVAYEGTIEQFKQITKSPGWYCGGVPEYIQCSDGNYYPTEYDTTEDPEYMPTFCLNIYDWETKEWLTDFLGIPEGISWQELENEYYYVTCESDVVRGTFGYDGVEGWIVYSDGSYVHPYDEISTSDETYYVTQVAPY